MIAVAPAIRERHLRCDGRAAAVAASRPRRTGATDPVRPSRVSCPRAVRRWLALSAGVALLAGGCASTAPASSGSSTTTTGASRTTATSTSTTTATTTTTTVPLPHGWTDDQLLAQLIMVGVEFSDIGAATQAVEAGAGGLVFFGAPASGSGPSITSGIEQLQRVADEHLFTATDEEGGGIARLSDVIGSMPWPRQMAEQMSTAQVQHLLTQQGSAMSALGVDMDLAPVLDTASSTDTIDDEDYRSFSEDGDTAAAYGLAFIDGLRAGGVIPVAKHFPGLGHANGDTDTGPAADPPLSQMVNDDLVPFASDQGGHFGDHDEQRHRAGLGEHTGVAQPAGVPLPPVYGVLRGGPHRQPRRGCDQQRRLQRSRGGREGDRSRCRHGDDHHCVGLPDRPRRSRAGRVFRAALDEPGGRVGAALS